MKKIALVGLMVAGQSVGWAQAPAPAPSIPAKPTAPAQGVPPNGVLQRPQNPNNQTPRFGPTSNGVPGATFTQTNQVDQFPNTNLAPGFIANSNNSAATFASTNRLDNPPDTNRPNVRATNAFGGANTNLGSSGQVFAVTNSLAQMAPAQQTSVLQFQANLNNLQALTTTLSANENAQQIVQQNPQVQQQLLQIARQIRLLARGQRPISDSTIQRLSNNLVVALLSARQFTSDRQLILAVLINQAANSGSLTQVQIDATVNGALVTLQESGVPPAQAQLVVNDLQSIVAELQLSR
jgi:hypothetical protein